jgi:glycosyltransferase involved in cell wall biosynthesis
MTSAGSQKVVQASALLEAGGASGRRWVFITWYPYCRRSDALSEQLGARSYLVHYLRFKVPYLAPFKYLLQGFKTLQILMRERPTIVLVANPPVVAPLLILATSKILGFRYVIDVHSGALQHARWAWSIPWQRFVARKALATVVTNEHMAEIVRGWGAKVVMIQDIALKLAPEGPADRYQGFHVVFVCTHSVDEPVAAVVEAARRLPQVLFSFTGDPSYAPKGFRESLPGNVRLTGFTPDAAYLSLLRGADAIMALTKEDHTMQRAAYEAMALEKPLITSHWDLLRQVFRRGTEHVDNTPEAIADAIEKIRAHPDRYGREMGEMKRERRAVSAAQVENLARICAAAKTGGSR